MDIIFIAGILMLLGTVIYYNYEVLRNLKNTQYNINGAAFVIFFFESSILTMLNRNTGESDGIFFLIPVMNVIFVKLSYRMSQRKK